jgi:K+-sensing histidine kinase KdpD
MEIKNALLWKDYTSSQAWLGTCLIVLAAFGIRYILHPVIAPYAVFHFFIVACLLIQYLYGYRFSWPAMGVSTILGEYYFVEPYGTFSDFVFKDFLIAFNFLLVNGVAMAFMERLRRTAYSRELLLKVMESRNKVSLLRENDRLFYAKKTNEIWAILEELILDRDQILMYFYMNKVFGIEPVFYKLASRFKLDDPLDTWEKAIHEDDVSQLKESFTHQNAAKAFDVRLIQEDGSECPVTVVTDHFTFMGKQLSILKLQ